MASNGKNGDKNILRDFGKESGGLAVAEAASMVTSLGVVGLSDMIAPGLVRSATKVVSRIVIEPYLDTIEKGLGKICKLEECRPDTTLSRQERAEQFAHALVLFAPSFVLSLGVKIATRRGMNKLMHIDDKIPGQKWWQVWKLTRDEKWIMGLDEGFHVGSLLLLNTGAARVTDDMIRATSSVLEKCGLSQKKAHELSNMAMIWEMPNAIGLAAGTVGVYGKHSGWWKK